jgi:hypothetical protein
MASGAGPAATRATILASIAAASTPALATALLDEYEEITRRFHRADFRPSELGGGRFGEAALRICQHICLGKFTPLSKKLPNVDQVLKELENSPTATADDAYRLHIPRTIRVIYDLRNKRDVAHLKPGSVSPNFTDASLILGNASWVVAEIVRLSHATDIGTAQSIVDGLVQRRVPLVWTEGDVVRVLDPSLKYWEQTLILLYHFHPDWVSEAQLVEWLGYSNPTMYRKRVLEWLHKHAFIHLKDGKVKILPPGLAHVEQTPKLQGK